MATPKDIEKDLREYANGAGFIKIGQLADYLGQKNTSRVKEKYTRDAFKLDNSPAYFIPDIAKNIYKLGLAVILSFSVLTSSFPSKAIEKNEFLLDGFEVMALTAYCCGEITANGSKVHEGGCACNTHVGDVAVVYTIDGEFLGYFECNDTGSSKGLQKGTVIDIYREDLGRCEDIMRISRGKCYVKWISGKG